MAPSDPAARIAIDATAAFKILIKKLLVLWTLSCGRSRSETAPRHGWFRRRAHLPERGLFGRRHSGISARRPGSPDETGADVLMQANFPPGLRVEFGGFLA